MSEIYSTISPAIARNPIEILIWVKPGVTAQNKQRVLRDIREGLRLWEAVPTSSLSFKVLDVVETATEPTPQPHQLMIIVGNGADLIPSNASGMSIGGVPGIRPSRVTA